MDEVCKEFVKAERIELEYRQEKEGKGRQEEQRGAILATIDEQNREGLYQLQQMSRAERGYNSYNR